MVNSIDRLTKVMNRCLLAVSCVFLLIIILSCFIQICTRYIPGFTFLGSEELARYSFIWMTYIGMCIGVGTGAHPAITVITGYLPGKYKRALEFVVNICILFFAAVFIFYGWKVVVNMSRQISVSFKINMGLVYFSTVFAAAGTAINGINNVLQLAFGKEA